MDLGLRDARVIVTGGAANIGRGIVHGFAAEGARVLICDVDAEQALRVQKEALELGASAAEICDVVSAVYGPVPLDHLIEYLRALQAAGLVEEVKR